MELKKWLRGMEKVFTIIDVPKEKKVNIETFYLSGEVGISWRMVKDTLITPKFIWSKFFEELRAKFYLIIIQ